MKCLSTIFVLLLFSSQLAFADFNSADAKLNRVYNEVIRLYKNDQKFVQKLRTAQKTWLKFRDAHLESRFPADDKRQEYGTVYSECASVILEELTNDRIKQLQTWVNGAEEGDICSGSVKIKDSLKQIN